MTANPHLVPAFAGLWAMVGGRPAAMGRVTITSPGEFLPSVYPVTAAATAVIGATVLAAAELHDARGGEVGDVTVDGRHAATAFRSERLFRVDGEPPPSPWDELSGYYRAAAGEWVQLHCNFPHHRGGVVEVLGTADDRGEVEAAIAAWDAQALEDRLAAAGMCASRFRSTEAWAEHAHGRHVRDEPLMTITPDRSTLGEQERRPWAESAGARPLSGVRVLDLSRVIAGPVCGRTLAALGADVLRVGAEHLPVIESVLPDTNLGKRYTHLDLRAASDRRAFESLLDGADVVIDGFRPGALDDRGYGSSDLWSRWPGLVVVDLSAYGADGPWEGRRGFDSLVQTATGIGWAGMEAAGTDGPKPLPAQALDHGTGWLGALGAIVALHRLQQGEPASVVDVALARTGAWLDSLGRIDGIDLPDPGPEDVVDLFGEVSDGRSSVAPVRFPGAIDGVDLDWTRPASTPGADPPVWDP